MARHSWRPMGKSVEPFWRYAQVAEGANRRLINALANAPLTGEATQELDELCRSRDRTRVARFNPVDAHTVLLFIAVLSSPSPACATATSRPSCSHLVRNPGMVPNETICGVRRFHRVVFQRCVRCPPILHESFKKLE